MEAEGACLVKIYQPWFLYNTAGVGFWTVTNCCRILNNCSIINVWNFLLIDKTYLSPPSCFSRLPLFSPYNTFTESRWAPFLSPHFSRWQRWFIMETSSEQQPGGAILIKKSSKHTEVKGDSEFVNFKSKIYTKDSRKIDVFSAIFTLKIHIFYQ